VSGIVGIVTGDSSTVDAELLESLTASLAFRGPDEQRTWTRGPAGLGHALLRTTDEPPRRDQPLSFDDSVWIVADARVDSRDELVADLRSEGRAVAPGAPDVELLLHAYHAWGEQCVHHLLGDFAFAVWDARRRSLFCARDHFGIKPFLYARLDGGLVFSNTLGCLRLHPSVSERLDDSAIADFLLFGFNRDTSATAFAEIRRLPPAHTLGFSPAGGLRVRRYWTLPVEEPIRYRRPAEYVEQFRDLFGQAVKDRLRTRSAAVLMSGGLDSSSIAATARPHVPDLRAYTIIAPRLLPDEEGKYSSIVAGALGIPIDHFAVDDHPLYCGWERPEIRPPEPCHEPFHGIYYEQIHRIASDHRVALTGQGGDPALSTSVTSYAALLLRRGHLGRFLADFSRFLLSEGRFSRLYPRTRFRVWSERRQPVPALPDWLNPEFSARLSLAQRWQAGCQPPPAQPSLRPTAYRTLQDPFWPYFFERQDPGSVGVPVDCRNPYFDLRLLRFLLRLPPVPWCTDKEIVRVAMRGLLPDPVRLRPKTPLQADQTALVLRRSRDRWWEKVPPAHAVHSYVNWDRVPRLTGDEDTSYAWLGLAPISLNLWLRGHQPAPATACAERRVPVSS
jgi:asparagine synthase (glutamine-hydrolysing)